MKSNDNTKERIIETASMLFLTKGYESTKLSDIIAGLNGLTKGAVYHYFDSKEDIFNAVVKEIGLKNKSKLDTIKYSQEFTGSEKLSKIVEFGIDNENADTITSMAPNLIESPKLLASFLSQIKDVTIPDYFLPIIKEGVEDGSITTDFPMELAELLALVLNIWFNPLIFKTSANSVSNKIHLMNLLTEQFDIKLFSEYM